MESWEEERGKRKEERRKRGGREGEGGGERAEKRVYSHAIVHRYGAPFLLPNDRQALTRTDLLISI